KEKLGADFTKIARIHANIKDKDMEVFKDTTNASMFRGGATYADAVTFGAEKTDKKLVEEFGKVRGKKVLPFNADSDLSDYIKLYSDLAK
ncbi:MAG TPA: hypothetical protein VJ647_02635, partial [Chitinophagaceae bacterium]|nr:hypothetical protein [Chitinophagaceae bacterium]